MLWFRWSLRDLRARWVQVVAIAFIIAIGTGLYSGLSSTSEWRRVSYDASYSRLHMYDLHVALSTGSYVSAADLVSTAQAIPHARWVQAAEPRLLVPTQVDASTDGKTVLVPGRLVGVDVANGGPQVNRVSATSGRTLTTRDDATNRAVIDAHFAKQHHLASRGVVRVSGGTALDYVGLGLSPEYFMIVGDRGTLLAEANYAVMFVPLTTAQRIAGRPGAANDLVLTLKPGADVRVVRQELGRALRERFPTVGTTINGPNADTTHRLMYDDIKGDQRLYDIFAVLILAGAAFAAFNLAGRIVEAQRREIGIGMALGVPRRSLAIRPLLVGSEIAFVGVLFGLAIGYVVSLAMGSVLGSYFPLPAWRFPFQIGTFARAAAIGFALPVLAAGIPVWRAVRVTPIDAIRTGFLSDKQGGLAPLLARLPLPGRTTAQMPLRNVLRAPRRTLMTAFGIAAAIIVLIGVIGMVDSFLATIDRGEHELTKTSPNRLLVALDSFYLDASPQVTAIEASPLVRTASPILQLPGSLHHGAKRIDTFVDLVDLRSKTWSPTIEHRVSARGPGIVISETAARDLGVHPGDTVVLRHPRRNGPVSYEFVRSKVTVIGVNPLPLRAAAFMDTRDAALMNLVGITNTVVVNPARNTSSDAVKRGLFGAPGVASVQPVTAYTDTVRQTLRSALGILRIVEAAVLLLALLIAFNSASINADERAREEATMFAFGLRVRTVLRIATVESLVIGVLATLLGLVVGWLLLDWLVTGLLPQTFPDLGIVTAVSTGTWLTAMGLGVLAVTVAPLFTVRKLRRMDVPSTLRVME
ncbi:MAG: FtsX-like permease family protein [Acidimicrobiia bacterium]